MKRLMAGIALLTLLTPPLTSAQTPASRTTTVPATLPAFTVGHDTTRITTPLLPDGRPDYVTASDTLARKNVTPDNNLLVALLPIFGTTPESMGKTTRDETLKRLGLPLEPHPGTYTSYTTYLQREKIQYTEAISKEEDDARKTPWSADEYPVIAKWLKENNAALDAAVAALAQRDKWYWPAVASSDRMPMISIILPSLGRVRDLANALTTRAMLRLDEGKIKEAQADLLAVHRLGHAVNQGFTLIDKLVGVAIDTLASRADITMASEKLTADQLKPYLADLNKLPPLHPMAESIDTFERYTTLDAVLAVRKYGFHSSLGNIDYDTDHATNIAKPDMKRVLIDAARAMNVNWDTVLKRVNVEYDHIVSAQQKPTFAERKTALDAWPGVIDKEFAHAQTDILDGLLANPTDRMTYLLIRNLMPSFGRASELSDRAVLMLDLDRVTLALALYKLEKGAYPDTLNALAPAYLKTVPNDLFINQPLHYQTKDQGYLLYSVGPTMVDHGGTEDRPGGFGKDVVIKKTR